MSLLDSVSDERILGYRDEVNTDLKERISRAFEGPERVMACFLFETTFAAGSGKEFTPRLLRNMRQLDSFIPACNAEPQDVLLMGLGVGSKVVRNLLDTQPALARACGYDPAVHFGVGFPYARFLARRLRGLHAQDLINFIFAFRRTYASTLDEHAISIGREHLATAAALVDQAPPGSPFSGMTTGDAMQVLSEVCASDDTRPVLEAAMMTAMRAHFAVVIAATDERDVQLGLLSNNRYRGVPRFF